MWGGGGGYKIRINSDQNRHRPLEEHERFKPNISNCAIPEDEANNNDRGGRRKESQFLLMKIPVKRGQSLGAILPQQLNCDISFLSPKRLAGFDLRPILSTYLTPTKERRRDNISKVTNKRLSNHVKPMYQSFFRYYTKLPSDKKASK